ncbi:MAG: hypothetical protein WCX64_00950 [Candidatus Micrarchaeia archaeon]
MQLSRHLALVALSIVMFMLPLAAAYNAATDASTVSMTSCSAGSIYAYAENTESTDATLSVSANFGKLYGSVTSPVQDLPAYESRGTKITVYSGSCFQGDEDVTVYFNVCRNTTLDSCTTIKKTVRMMVEPCTACSSYVEQHLPPVDNYAPATSTCVGSGCGQPLVSNINFATSYEPSDITVDISFARERYEVVAGSSLQTDVIVTNRGVPVTLDLALDGYASELGASLQEHTVGLGASESHAVALSMNPPSTASGEQCLDVVATRRGVEVERRTACFSVLEAAGATVSAPLSAGTSDCGEDATYKVSVENTGAFTNTFTFTSGSDAVRIVPSKVTIPAGESETATVTVNATRLGFAQDVEVTVTGGRTGGVDSTVFRQSAVTNILASACATRNEVSSDNRNFTVTEGFYNPSQGIIYGVTGTIEGLPSGFVVEQAEGLQDVAPDESINVTLTVSAPSDAQGEVAGVLVLRSQDGTVVKQRAVVLNTVSEGGITGFFTKAVGSNLSLIIAILVAAAVVALLYGRTDLRQAVSEKVETAKDAIANVAQKPSDAAKPAEEKKAAAGQEPAGQKPAEGKAAAEKKSDTATSADAEAGDSATINS